jgi:hypothetical protein
MSTSFKFDPNRRCKKVADWPAPDRDLWMAALLPGDILDDGGPRARHSTSSNHNIAKGYGRYLSWLENRGMLDILQGPADRIVPCRVRDFVVDQEKAGVATGTVLNRLVALQVIAKISDARRDWFWINRIASSVRARHKPAWEKRHRLVAVRVLYDPLLARLQRRPFALNSFCPSTAPSQSRRAISRPHTKSTGWRMVDLDPSN